MRPLRSLVVLLALATGISSSARIAHAQPAHRPAMDAKLASIFGALVFDSLRSADMRTETNWFVRDSLTFQLLSPAAKSHGLRLQLWPGARSICPWKSPFPADSAGRAAAALIGYTPELFTRVDSAGHSVAGARVGCSAVDDGSGNWRRNGFGTGMDVEITMKSGEWRIIRVVSHWIT